MVLLVSSILLIGLVTGNAVLWRMQSNMLSCLHDVTMKYGLLCALSSLACM